MVHFSKKYIFAPFIVTIILLSGCAGTKPPSPPSYVTLGPGDYHFSMKHDGMTRIYKVHVPPGYDKNKPLPVVLIFHGGAGNAMRSVSFFNLNPKADKEGFIAVYPEGTGKRIKGEVFGSWNAGACCAPAKDERIDDVGFISALLDKFERDLNVDTKRIFATGHSNGALMSYRLACELSDRIAAIAVAGAQDAFNDCRPKRPVPVIHFHGTEDKCAPYNGGVCGGCIAKLLNKLGIPADISKGQWQCRSAPDYIGEWRIIDGCSPVSKMTYHRGTATCISYDQCNDKAEVTLCTLEGMGHTWPGGDYGSDACRRDNKSALCALWKDTAGNLSQDISANDMMWDFFKKHPMR